MAGRGGASLISPRLVTSVVSVSLTLLVVVVGFGIYRGELDFTAVAGVLCTLVSGVVLGALMRGKPPHPPDGDEG